jgi:DNA-binding transcriptional ArsR family regulator
MIMEIDKKTIKALSADARLEILKALKERRKMPSELSKELDLAPSTIVEHLKVLEETGLVERKDTGRKWIYYELTNKGDSLIKPRFPVEFVLMLSLGTIFILSGVLTSTSIEYQNFTYSVTKDVSTGGAPVAGSPTKGAPSAMNIPTENRTENVTTNETITVPITKLNYSSIALAIIGVIILAITIVNRKLIFKSSSIHI